MQAQKIKSKRDPQLEVNVYQGHIATKNCHTSHYIDITSMKHEHVMAREAAMAIAARYSYFTQIDTIVCIDGSEVIGAFLAYHLTEKGNWYLNAKKNIGVVPTEFDAEDKLVFRDNLTYMIDGKNVLLLISTVKSGKTIARVLEALKGYGAVVQGIATVFSTTEELEGIPVYSLFTREDLPDYVYASAEECPMCAEGKKIDAIANSYGISKL